MASYSPDGDTLSSPLVHLPKSAYTPLPSSSIRILTLSPGLPTDPLKGTLTIESLPSTSTTTSSSTTPSLSYEAISYVWGSESRPSSIICNYGISIPLTTSLNGALRHMRLPNRPRRLWADQLCINQEDLVERSQQVQLMNAIYKGAERILVWLGEDEEGVAEQAKEMVHLLQWVFENDDAHDEFREAHSEKLMAQSKSPWVPLSKLTKLPWFNRIWIVQEIGTAAPATLYWGSISLDWAVLSKVSGILNEEYHYLRSHFTILTPGIRYLYQRFVEPLGVYDENHNRGNFIFELHRARHLKAKDPRDHVYAFLGHFSLSNGSKELLGLEADYAKPVQDVYMDVATRALKDARTLILLSASYTVTSVIRQPDFTPLDLPSWVPDWRIKPLPLIGSPQNPHRASGTTAPKLTIDARTLHIHGVRLDTIESVSSTLLPRAFQFRSHGRLPIHVIWKDVCGLDDFNLDIAYPLSKNHEADNEADGDFAFYALVQTLTNACTGMSRTQPYEFVSKIEWLSHGAAYLIRDASLKAQGSSSNPLASSSSSINKVVDISPAIYDLAHGGDPFKWSHEATLVTRHRRFAVTKSGYFVMGPDVMEKGDELVVLYGGRTPFVVRTREDGNGLALLGECYVHGMMNGEALDRPGAEEVFTIR